MEQLNREGNIIGLIKFSENIYKQKRGKQTAPVFLQLYSESRWQDNLLLRVFNGQQLFQQPTHLLTLTSTHTHETYKDYCKTKPGITYVVLYSVEFYLNFFLSIFFFAETIFIRLAYFYVLLFSIILVLCTGY